MRVIKKKRRSNVILSERNGAIRSLINIVEGFLVKSFRMRTFIRLNKSHLLPFCLFKFVHRKIFLRFSVSTTHKIKCITQISQCVNVCTIRRTKKISMLAVAIILYSNLIGDSPVPSRDTHICYYIISRIYFFLISWELIKKLFRNNALFKNCTQMKP